MGRLGMPILFFVLRGGDKFSAFVDRGGKQAIMVGCTTMWVQPVCPDTEAAMDITERKITKIAREAEKLVRLTLREKLSLRHIYTKRAGQRLTSRQHRPDRAAGRRTGTSCGDRGRPQSLSAGHGGSGRLRPRPKQQVHHRRPAPDPVSYTHLDVYKRQVLFQAVRRSG